MITALGGYTVEGISDLTRALRKFEPGETTTITVSRAGQTLALSITLDEKPRENPSGTVTAPDMPSSGDFQEWFNYFFGE